MNSTWNKKYQDRKEKLMKLKAQNDKILNEILARRPSAGDFKPLMCSTPKQKIQRHSTPIRLI